MCDGIRIGEPGSEIAKLVGYGFVEISAANGHDALAKVGAGVEVDETKRPPSTSRSPS